MPGQASGTTKTIVTIIGVLVGIGTLIIAVLNYPFNRSQATSAASQATSAVSQATSGASQATSAVSQATSAMRQDAREGGALLSFHKLGDPVKTKPHVLTMSFDLENDGRSAARKVVVHCGRHSDDDASLGPLISVGTIATGTENKSRIDLHMIADPDDVLHQRDLFCWDELSVTYVDDGGPHHVRFDNAGNAEPYLE